ncbi:hypothetical protein ABUE34_03815 [Kozakia baliensis]|uniref:hypothetical protein n=1 Tax=Kozakia baliensis TaxID=153496 RepID=UPI00345B97EC
MPARRDPHDLAGHLRLIQKEIGKNGNTDPGEHRIQNGVRWIKFDTGLESGYARYKAAASPRIMLGSVDPIVRTETVIALGNESRR